jgi:azurin
MSSSRHGLYALALLASAPAARAADPCQLEISANDVMQYDKKELSAPGSCKQITLTLHHTGKLPREAMGHNWVLVSAADSLSVASAGMGAGLAKDYVPAGDKRVLAHTRVIGGGETTRVSFASALLRKGAAYQFECTFPGHNALMHGDFRLL